MQVRVHYEIREKEMMNLSYLNTYVKKIVRYTYWLNFSVPGVIEIQFLIFISALKTFEIFHYENET